MSISDTVDSFMDGGTLSVCKMLNPYYMILTWLCKQSW